MDLAADTVMSIDHEENNAGIKQLVIIFCQNIQ